MDFKTFRDNASGAKKGLLQRRKDVGNRISALERDVGSAKEELARIDAEISAMDAFESAVAGIPAGAPKRGGRPPGKRGKKRAKARKTGRIGRKSVRRVQIVDIIKEAGATGIGRGEIIAALQAKGDRIDTNSAKQSVSNVLATIKKSGEVGYADNKYKAS